MGSETTPPPPDGDGAAWDAGAGDDLRPGPIPLPPGLRGKRTVLGWVVSVVVVLLAVVVYFTTRPSAPLTRTQPPPTWGTLTLAHVALGEAKAAGDAHPSGATWLFTHRDQVVPVLSGGAAQGAEADYVVALKGHFQAPRGGGGLPGSQSSGSRLIVLVRAFDGTVTGWFLTDQLPAGLDQLGLVHPLPLGGL